ncbi:unnamed protein product [Oreochromis niloticus]|nr:unnamed protein product [Mustela putorius furo]
MQKSDLQGTGAAQNQLQEEKKNKRKMIMESWDARLLMERSRAVMSPDISAHLAGTKKVQQVLARPGVLERFFLDQPQAVQQI